MYENNRHTGINNDNYPPKIDKKFLDRLSAFIQSVESEMDIMLPGIASLQFLSYYKIIDYVISQKLAKNIVIRLLCPFNEDNTRLTAHLIPFVGYRSIKTSLPKTSSNSVFLIRDKCDIFSFSVNMKIQRAQHDKQDNETIFSLDSWSYSNDISIVRNTVYCFDLIWEEKENHDKIIKEKMHSELLSDLILHDIGNYHQTIQNSIDIATSILKKDNNDTNKLSPDNERIFSILTVAKKALDKS